MAQLRGRLFCWFLELANVVSIFNTFYTCGKIILTCDNHRKYFFITAHEAD